MLKHKPTAQSGSGVAPTSSKFAFVALASNKKTIVCKLANGAIYELPLVAFSNVEGWDSTGAQAVDTIDGGFGALLILVSGKQIDFATDFVLHHCESAYAYHYTKVKPSRIGTRIREFRHARGLTLKQIEAKTGIKEPNLSRLENDKHIPSLETLVKIAKALQISVSEVVGASRAPAAVG